ncbi:hypothetical protein [Streptomyces sp. NBC_00078]|uniref:hypothetical protein n=1 Tax=Streptomyces sp. NBC_00078 TaxID=2975643 RepID=UPI002B1E6A48|nr:hypothetical protein [Streptomyces sp. NBC_00078]
MDDDALLAEQMAYYGAGAAEYDRPYAEYEDLQRLLAVVEDLPIAGDVLEWPAERASGPLCLPLGRIR